MRTLCIAIALSVCAMLPASSRAGSDACPVDEELAYVCGLQRPEDIVALPEVPWLVASGFSTGAGLKLIDTRSRSVERWFEASPGQLNPDRRTFPDCPGPVNPALFNARGLSLRQTGPGSYRLLVVNHGGRESIEAFDVATGGSKPRVTWRGCVPMPVDQVANSVAQFADGTVLATVLTSPGTTIGDFMLGRSTGAVWQWKAGQSRFEELPGTRLPGNNGIETDPDQKRFYVVAFGWHSVVVFDRRDTTAPLARIEAADFMPDNIHWTGGRLLIAGMRLDEPACGGLRKVVNGVADPMLCHRGWIVGEVDLDARRVSTLAYGRPSKAFNGLSAAALSGRELWLGSFQSDRLAVLPRQD